MRCSPSLSISAAILALSLCVTLGACGGGGAQNPSPHDIDHDGIVDELDNDMDGDGRLNQFDDDVDGDGVFNLFDSDADDDGLVNESDETPLGVWIPAPQTLFVSVGVATVSFGDVPQGQLAGPATITIQNDTINPATVERVALAGSGAGAYELDPSSLPARPFVLAPGGSTQMRATFRPASGTPALGRIEVDLRIGPGLFVGVVHLLGQGTAPALTTSGNPSTINFGDVPVGVTAGPGIARIANDTNAAYVISSIDLTGTGGGTFALDLSALPGGGTLPLNLSAGTTVEFWVTFTPRQGVPSVGAVEVALDGPGGASVGTLDLLGQGLAPAMTLRPAELDFGTALTATEASEIGIEVRNEFYSNGTLNVSAITLVDDAGGDYSIVTDPTPFSIAPGGAPVVVRVRFAPLAGHFGPRVGRLRVQGDDPLFPIDRTETLAGRGAGWQAPATTLATNWTAPGLPNAPEPVWLAGSSRFVARSAGQDGQFGGLVLPDDEIVVVDADPDGDASTNDARVLVRWSGFRLTPEPSGRPVDAGTGQHVFFTGPGLDDTLGTGDDEINVLDTVSGNVRTLPCPNQGARKSRPTLVDPSTGLVVVSTGVGGWLLPSSDTLLVYDNLLGNVNALAPDETISLGVVVPDFVACAPVAVGSDTVVQPIADGDEDPDLSDRSLDDGNEGLVQVRALHGSPVVEVLGLGRALAEVGAAADGELFCQALVLGSSTVLVATEGANAASQVDDELVRVDGVGTAALAVGAVVTTSGLSGLGSRPTDLGAGVVVLASTGADASYGTSDDLLRRVVTTGAMSATSFGPGGALAGAGGSATRPLALAGEVLVATAGIDGNVGTGDDRVLALDATIAGPASILGVLPVPGGLFAGNRSTERSLAGPTRLDDRFVAVLDCGGDSLEGTADDVLRVFRDKDRDGSLGTSADDLDGDGVFGLADTVIVPMPFSDGARTSLASTSVGHFLTIRPGTDGVLGTGQDDAPVLWWLREALTLP